MISIRVALISVSGFSDSSPPQLAKQIAREAIEPIPDHRRRVSLMTGAMTAGGDMDVSVAPSDRRVKVTTKGLTLSEPLRGEPRHGEIWDQGPIVRGKEIGQSATVFCELFCLIPMMDRSDFSRPPISGALRRKWRGDTGPADTSSRL